MFTFGSFLEHAAAMFDRWRREIPDFHVPGLAESRVFWLGEDLEFYDHVKEIRMDLLDEMKATIPMPFPDLTCVSVVRRKSRKSEGGDTGPSWTLDRIFENPSFLPRMSDDGRISVRGQKLLVVRYQYFEDMGEGLGQPMIWLVGYTGIEDPYVTFDLQPSTTVARWFQQDSGALDRLREETKVTLDEVVAISHPSNYVVRVAPKLTPREERRVTSGKKYPMQKCPHFVVVSHEVLVGMRAKPAGTHASPVPHERRGHWARLAERCRHAKLLGKEKVWRRPTFVGDPAWSDHAHHYEVLLDFPSIREPGTAGGAK